VSEVDNAWLAKLYKAFNKRDIETVLAAMTDDVSCPDVEDEYRRVKGKDNLRQYWRMRLDVFDIVVTPLSFSEEGGNPVVQVRHVIRDRSRRILSDRDAKHTFTLSEGLIARLDIRWPSQGIGTH
jgi:hypothetical protein